MNNKAYFSSAQENVDNSMEWEEDEGIGKNAASSFDLNVASGYAFSQPSTSGYTGQKRKSSFSSTLPPKISRNMWNGQQQEEHASVNETNMREVASGFSTVPTANYISSSFDPNISSGYASSQPSTSGYTGQNSQPPSRITKDIWDGKQQHEENSSLNKTNSYNNREMASGFATAPPIPQMMQVEQRDISSQAYSDNKSSLLVKADIECSKADSSADFSNQTSSSFDPNVASGFTLSQPSTSEYTGRKSPPPSTISRDIWDGKQQHEDNSSLNKTNPYNNREMASGFAFAPPISQMVSAIPCQSKRDNIPAAVPVADDTDCFKDNILVHSMLLTGPDVRLKMFRNPDKLRKKLIRLLNFEESVPEINSPKSVTDRERLDFFYVNEQGFRKNFNLPERYCVALRRHLRHHCVNEISDNFYYSQVFIPLRESNCMICKLYFGFLNHPNQSPKCCH